MFMSSPDATAALSVDDDKGRCDVGGVSGVFGGVSGVTGGVDALSITRVVCCGIIVNNQSLGYL